MQCPGCWSADLVEDPRPEGYIECDCGEKWTVIDLRDGPNLTVDRGSLSFAVQRLPLGGEPEEWVINEAGIDALEASHA
jgi:hypothetical protein